MAESLGSIPSFATSTNLRRAAEDNLITQKYMSQQKSLNKEWDEKWENGATGG